MIKINKTYKSRCKLRCIDDQNHAGVTLQSLRAAVGPLQDNRPLLHYVIGISGMLPYIHVSRSLEIFPSYTILSHGSITLPPRQSRVFARLARWQKDKQTSHYATSGRYNITARSHPVISIAFPDVSIFKNRIRRNIVSKADLFAFKSAFSSRPNERWHMMQKMTTLIFRS